MRRRIGLMRASEDAERTAARLFALGYAAVLAPAMQVRATFAEAPPGPWDAIVATSAKVFDLPGAVSGESIAGPPLFVVGARTARAAGARGLAVAESREDSATMAERLLARLRPGSRVLYLAGRDRKSDLERALAAAGRAVVALEVYAAEPRPAWSREEARDLAGCDAALHYSARSAEIALRLAQHAGIGEEFRSLPHACISDDAAAPLRAFGAPGVHSAPRPDEDALLATLARALRRE